MTTAERLFDLHVHSTASDGALSPNELARLAKLSGLAGLAVTDHDILPNREALASLEKRHEITFLTGVEISTTFGLRRLHLLGYAFDPDQGTLQQLCQRNQETRRRRIQSMMAALRERRVTFDDVARHRLEQTVSPGRRHLARELIRLRQATSARDAFARWLAPLDTAVEPVGVELASAVQAIHAAGGVAILAHPPTGMDIHDWQLLKETGLDGLETRFGRVARRHRRFLEERVAENDWLATAGSDYHGDGPPGRIGLHSVTESVVAAILERARLVTSGSASDQLLTSRNQ